MSQVVVTKDALDKKRQKSHSQEKAIDRNSVFKKWQMSSSAEHYDPLTKIVGIAILPVLFLWGFLASVMLIVINAIKAILNILANMVGKKK